MARKTLAKSIKSQSMVSSLRYESRYPTCQTGLRVMILDFPTRFLSYLYHFLSTFNSPSLVFTQQCLSAYPLQSLLLAFSSTFSSVGYPVEQAAIRSYTRLFLVLLPLHLTYSGPPIYLFEHRLGSPLLFSL